MELKACEEENIRVRSATPGDAPRSSLHSTRMKMMMLMQKIAEALSYYSSLDYGPIIGRAGLHMYSGTDRYQLGHTREIFGPQADEESWLPWIEDFRRSCRQHA